MIKNLNKLAREIVEGNQYITLSTCYGGVPWISPVVYTYDKNWNFYFVSMPSSKHCLNLSKNKKVACAIFDSQQLWGMGVGLQIEAVCEVIKLKDVAKIAKLYATRKYPYGGLNTKIAMDFIRQMVTKRKMYKIYKITPKTVWMNDPNSDTDIRVKVSLN